MPRSGVGTDTKTLIVIAVFTVAAVALPPVASQAAGFPTTLTGTVTGSCLSSAGCGYDGDELTETWTATFGARHDGGGSYTIEEITLQYQVSYSPYYFDVCTTTASGTVSRSGNYGYLTLYSSTRAYSGSGVFDQELPATTICDDGSGGATDMDVLESRDWFVTGPGKTYTGTGSGIVLDGSFSDGFGGSWQWHITASGEDPDPEPTPTPTPTYEPPAVTVADADMFEGETDRTMNFRVSLSRKSPRQIVVAYRTGAAGDTATKGATCGAQGADYADAAPLGDAIGVLTFRPGVKSKLLPVTICGDELDPEGPPNFGDPGSVSEYQFLTVTLESATNAEADDQAQGRIHDNDGAVLDAPAGATVAQVTQGAAAICPGGVPPCVAVGPNTIIGEGDTVTTNASGGARIILNDGSVVTMDKSSTLVWREPTLLNQTRGQVWYSLLPELNARWTYRALNARVVAGCCGTAQSAGVRAAAAADSTGQEFTISTTRSADTVRSYSGSITVVGSKGGKRDVSKGYQTVCKKGASCSRPTKFNSSSDRFWESSMCAVGLSCVFDTDDAEHLDIRDAVLERSGGQIQVTIRTFDAWTVDDLYGWSTFYVELDTKGDGYSDYEVFAWQEDGELTGLVWDLNAGSSLGTATVTKPGDRSIEITFSEQGLEFEENPRWYAWSGWDDEGDCAVTDAGDYIQYICWDDAPNGTEWGLL